MIMPGSRVLVFDPTLYKDDVKTPLSETMRPATVVNRYGKKSAFFNGMVYPDLVDVKFDHRGLSCGHFTHMVKEL